MRRLRVRGTARAEIASAFAWYLERSPAAAGRFLEAVDEAMRRIEEAPKRYPIIHGRLRRVLLRRFPYGVYYKAYPSTISVVGVIMATGTWTRGRDGLRPDKGMQRPARRSRVPSTAFSRTAPPLMP